MNKEQDVLQTVLEELECSYLSITNIIDTEKFNEEVEKGINYIDKEELFNSFNAITISIIQLILFSDCIPTDKRVYKHIVRNNNVFSVMEEGDKINLLRKLRKYNMLQKHIRVEELITFLNSETQDDLYIELEDKNGKKYIINTSNTYTDMNILVLPIEEKE